MTFMWFLLDIHVFLFKLSVLFLSLFLLFLRSPSCLCLCFKLSSLCVLSPLCFFFIAALSSRTLLGLSRTDTFLLLVSSSSTNVPFSFSLFLHPPPSAPPPHSAISRTSLVTSLVYDSALLLIHLNEYLPPFSQVALWPRSGQALTHPLTRSLHVLACADVAMSARVV